MRTKRRTRRTKSVQQCEDSRARACSSLTTAPGRVRLPRSPAARSSASRRPAPLALSQARHERVHTPDRVANELGQVPRMNSAVGVQVGSKPSHSTGNDNHGYILQVGGCKTRTRQRIDTSAGIEGWTGGGTDLVHQVDCLVRQEPAGDVPGRQSPHVRQL